MSFSADVYKLCCNDVNITEIYVGSTRSLRQRKGHHKQNCNNSSGKYYNVYVYEFIRNNGGFGNWSMISLYTGNFENKKELHRKEREFIEELKSSLNCKIPTRTHKEWREDNIETLKQKSMQYYEDNRETLLIKMKQYRDNNKEKIAQQDKKHRENNKEEAAIRNKNYREKNKETLNAKKKQYYVDNQEKIEIQKKQYYENHKEEAAIRNKNYREKNKETLKEISKQYREDNREKIEIQKKQYYENHKEEAAITSKNYREKNKETIKAGRNSKTTCGCGLILSKCSMWAHVKTKKHIEWSLTQTV